MQSLKSLVSLSLLDSIVSPLSSDGVSCRFRFLVCCWDSFLCAVSNSAASTLSWIFAVLSMKWLWRAALLPDCYFCLLFKTTSWSFVTLCKIVTCVTRHSVIWMRIVTYLHSSKFSLITADLKIALTSFINSELGIKLIILCENICYWFNIIE